jgi:hypothetical protein
VSTDRLKLYNGALILCGATTLHSSTGLTESRDERRQLDAAWDQDALRTCLEAGQWKFAKRTVEIPYTGDVAAVFGFSYVFEKPDDYIRVCGVFSDPECREPLLDYEEDGDYFYANIDTIYVQYVSDDNEYGMDFAKWPQSFTRFVEAYLADKVALKVTAGDEKRIAKVERTLKSTKADALEKDAQKSPTKFPPAGGWVRARGGSSNRRDRWPTD